MFVDACNVIQERKVERKPTRILPWGGGAKQRSASPTVCTSMEVVLTCSKAKRARNIPNHVLKMSRTRVAFCALTDQGHAP